jgi:hypothetical protein
MAKRDRTLPLRKPREGVRDVDSILIRSAESLGRMIGALQRQLDGAAKTMTRIDGRGMRDAAAKAVGLRTPTRRKTRTAKPAGTSGANSAPSTADRKRRRTRASKPAAAKKTATGSRSAHATGRPPRRVAGSHK